MKLEFDFVDSVRSGNEDVDAAEGVDAVGGFLGIIW